MSKPLYRVKKNSVIGGVAAGLAEYFSIDPTLVRVLFVVAFVIGGAGLLTYILLWIIIPEKESLAPGTDINTADMNNTMNDRKRNITGGLVLIVIGFIFLASEFLPWVHFGKLWPLILIAVGVGILWKRDKQEESPSDQPKPGEDANS